MKDPFVAIRDRHWIVSDFKDPKGMQNRTELSFPATKKGVQKFTAFLREHKINAVMCSSSVDFPIDGGLPKTYPARDILHQALFKPGAEAAALEVLRRPVLKKLLQRVACKTKGKEDVAVRLLLARIDDL